jgi:hypothetical protein
VPTAAPRSMLRVGVAPTVKVLRAAGRFREMNVHEGNQDNVIRSLGSTDGFSLTISMIAGMTPASSSSVLGGSAA